MEMKPATTTPQWPPLNTCRGDLTPHINKMLSDGVIVQMHMQMCYPSNVLPSSRFSTKIDRWQPSNYRPLLPIPTLTLPHLKNARRFKKQKLHSKTRVVLDLSDTFHQAPVLLFILNNGGIENCSRSENTRVCVYRRLDPIVYINQFTKVEHSLQNYALMHPEIRINWAKSILSPTITYLGVLWNGPNYTMSPSIQNLNSTRSSAGCSIQRARLENTISETNRDIQISLHPTWLQAPPPQTTCHDSAQVQKTRQYLSSNWLCLSPKMVVKIERNLSNPAPISLRHLNWLSEAMFQFRWGGGICS